MLIRPSWANWKFWLKAIGLVLLVAYLWHYPLDFDIVWVGAYLALVLGIGAAFALVVNPILERLIPTQRFDPSPYGDRRVADAKRRRWLEVLLLPGEDGFFFVPLLLVGVNPITAAVTAVAYAAIHYPEFPVKHCVVKAIVLFLIALLVLPNGLASVIVGHIILDVFAYLVWKPAPSQLVASESNGQ